MTVYSESFEGRKAGLYPELFSTLTNPTSPQSWIQLALHVWDVSKLKEMEAGIRTSLNQKFDYLINTLKTVKSMDSEKLVEFSQSETKAFLDREIMIQSSLLQMGKDFPMTASLSRLGWNLEQFLRLYDTHKSVLINIPSEYGIIIPAERYWRKFYARARPSFRDAFIMWRKGLVEKSLPKSILLEDVGMNEDLAEKFLQHAFYDPSPGELARIHRTVPLPINYIIQKLKNAGFSDEDIGYFALWITKEAVKDELIAISRILQDEYALGTLGMKAFEDFHREWKFSDDEINLRKETAEILRAKYVLKLRRDAKIYLYRRGILTEDQLYDELKKLGIADEVANAIVENEAAKKGIVWAK